MRAFYMPLGARLLDTSLEVPASTAAQVKRITSANWTLCASVNTVNAVKQVHAVDALTLATRAPFYGLLAQLVPQSTLLEWRIWHRGAVVRT